MSPKENNSQINKLFTEYLNEISSQNNSEEYLRAEGIDPDDLLKDGLRKIKQLKMRVASAKTESTYTQISSKLLLAAKEKVRELMENPGFDFKNFLKKESITIAYRNLESISPEEVREFLEKHILLKLQKDSEKEKGQ